MKKEEIKELLYTLLYLIIYMGIFIFIIPHTLLNFFQKWNIPHPLLFAFGSLFPIHYLITKISLKKKHKKILKDIEELNDIVDMRFKPDFLNLFNSYSYSIRHKSFDNISLDLVLSNYESLHVVIDDIRLEDFDCDMFYPNDTDFSQEINFSRNDLFKKSVFHRKKQKTEENMCFVYESIKVLGAVMSFSNKKSSLRFRFYGNYDEMHLEYWKVMIEIAEKYNRFLKDNKYYKTLPLYEE